MTEIGSGRAVSWSFLLKLAVSGVLVAFLLRSYDTHAVYRQAAAADPLALAAAAAILLAIALPMARRWSCVLKVLGAPAPVKTTLPAVLIGSFFNQALPSNIGGDAFRVWEIATATGIRLPLALTSVAIDRVAGFAALFILMTVIMPFLFAMAASPMALGLVVALLAGYGAICALMMLDLLHRPLARFRLARALAQFSADMRRVLLSPNRAAPIIGYGLVSNAAAVLALYILGRGLGIPVSLVGCFVVGSAAALLAAVPVSVAGWGVREGTFVAGFGMMGVSGADALTLSVLFGLLGIAASLPGGLLWLARRKSGRAGG
jgi:glycosyltransferase 2 family protein